jgi:uncharacterized protein DUF4410
MRVFLLAPLVLLLVSSPGATSAQQEEPKPAAAPAQPQVADASTDKSKVVYVSDFELDVLHGKEDKNPPASVAAPAAPSDAKKEEGPAEQASRLVDLMSSTLVKELEQAGYTAHRLRPGEAKPSEGVAIRGVFAEPDEQNRLRRVVVGASSGAGKMALFVGVSNLSRPEQPLYAVADPKSSESTPGAVITVSAYAPVAKFEMPKIVTEKAVKDTASAIAADLTVLLNTNIAALTH